MTSQHTAGTMAPLNQTGLLYTPQTKKAMEICFQAHRDQKDKGGLPYVFHPFHVAEQLSGEEEICTALLHDVVEDTDWSLEDLARAGISPRVLEALKLLTHRPGQGYLSYVAQLRKDPIARRVKLADLSHNSMAGRLDRPDQRRLRKYAMAKAILADDWYDTSLGHWRKQIPLDLEGIYYLSVFYRAEGEIEKYSLDVERAEDSHYEFDFWGGERLRASFREYPSLPEALGEFLSEGSDRTFRHRLITLGIPFQEFHYD
ncbi:MAG: bifunctional (p)ppGpp synthetase/guanosine-3',5'-bis(diphosphate) 3'-pyrophosphohydrolase [Oscillospiraceae bacterium]|nr:bifunctional (p)ppGpp synthetase/guanosine-3',5'-bis(diphosphate) 3'-pyrophosphohydrolase [Oscillospiraceae bacterium]